MKKVILIPDSFKGTMSSAEICEIMGACIHCLLYTSYNNRKKMDIKNRAQRPAEQREAEKDDRIQKCL